MTKRHAQGPGRNQALSDLRNKVVLTNQIKRYETSAKLRLQKPPKLAQPMTLELTLQAAAVFMLMDFQSHCSSHMLAFVCTEDVKASFQPREIKKARPHACENTRFLIVVAIGDLQE